MRCNEDSESQDSHWCWTGASPASPPPVVEITGKKPTTTQNKKKIKSNKLKPNPPNQK
jgi:hypothetical protein